MANFISEDQIEKATIDVLVNKLGYRHKNCYDTDCSGREQESDVVIKPLLRSQLIKLNPDLPEKSIDDAFNLICQTRFDMSDLMANKEIYGLIKDGVRVKFNNAKGKKEEKIVKVIDFADETKNDFLVTSQLWVQGDFRLRPDLIIYVNGLPVIFIELKNSNIALRNAYDDNLTRYKEQIPLLFRYNAICILSNGLETKVGSFNSGYEHFFNWLRPEHETDVPDKKRIAHDGISLNYAVLGLCEKRRLLDYLENFIFYYNDVIKIAAKNHQFLGVNNAIENFSNRLLHDKEGTDLNNKGKLGVFWHTQGSGKSYSMLFFTRKVFRKFTGNYTFLIVTDREELDGQIYRNFLGAGAFTKNEKCQPKDSKELRKMLQSNSRYIFTLIHKFRFDKGKEYPVLSDRNDIIVIVDEAHRTQYKDLAENMRRGLPNAQYIAFTGTPLLGSRELTKNWFGDTISEYNFKQSIEDEATVPLFYNKRVPEICQKNENIDEDLAEIFEDENLTDDQQEKLEREFGQEMRVLKTPDRLEKIAQDIVNHFPRRGYLGKGMVITIDKFTAVTMYDNVKRLWEQEIRNVRRQISDTKDEAEKEELRTRLDWMRDTDMAVIISEEAGEDEKFEKKGLAIEAHRKRMMKADENGKDLETNFKDPAHPLRLVFVCSMWLTGFDAPTVSTLYLDKPMKDHTLMQTITRANRVTNFTINGKPKINGLIVDYYNVFRNLKKAFASYGGGTLNIGDGTGEDSPVRDISELFNVLRDAIIECKNYCLSIGIDLEKITTSEVVFSKLGLFDEFADLILSDDERKNQFTVYDNTIDALYEACKPEIVSRRKEFALKDIIHYLREVVDGKVDRGNLDNAKRRINQLLDESILTADSVKDEDSTKYVIKTGKEIDLSKLDVNKLKEQFKQATFKNIEIADLRAFITDKLDKMVGRNVTRKSFAQKLQDIIDNYNNGRVSQEDYVALLFNFVEQLTEEEERNKLEGLTEDELEVFDLIKKDLLTKEEKVKVKAAAKSLLQRLKKDKPKVLITDWHKDSQSKSRVQTTIKKVLDGELPETYDTEVYDSKCQAVFQHYYTLAVMGDKRAFG